MSTLANRRNELEHELAAMLVRAATASSTEEREPGLLELECPYCGRPLDDDGFCDFDGATVLGGLPEPR